MCCSLLQVVGGVMSTSWIKVEVTTPQKIEVLTIADLLDIEPHCAFGKLVVLWCWADVNTIDGHANGVTKILIDSVVGLKGFAEAMLDTRVGWLREEDNGMLFFANFDRHNGKGAKKRSVDARRKSLSRSNVLQMSREDLDKLTTKTSTRKEIDKSKSKESIRSEPKYHTDTDKVIDYLNLKLNGTFRKSNSSRLPISGRLNEGYTLQECCLVIDSKVKDWGNNKYANYLRPKTLFAASNFGGYLNACKQINMPQKYSDDEVLG